VRFVNRKEGHRRLLQPRHGVLPRQALRRKVEQPECALGRCAHHFALFIGRLAAVEHGRWNAHSGQLRLN